MKRRVAIIGYSFRFPSTSTNRFWADLLAGRDFVSQVDPARWTPETFFHPNKAHQGTSYTFSAGSLGDVSRFDADFFSISPREAALMDPQQRLLLELAWEAMENAGLLPTSLRGTRCGVYVGISNSDYAYRLADDLAAIDSSVSTGNTFSIAANRLSYFFDLRGPSMAIDTACSSSLVAFHQACCSIVSGEVPYALAGGVNLHLHPYGFITFSKASMLSKRGRCRVFDASADGYVRSEGGGIFILKNLDQALVDGDRILAVVAASAANADGRKSGLTVPSAAAQAELLEGIYRRAGIDAVDIDYLEAHGTGTSVGDPIEASAIQEALGKQRPPGQPLWIGSVKSNLGHMEAAAGVAGLAKALESIRHRVVPATIGVEALNPRIPFNEWNIRVVTESKRLRKTGRVIIGVNGFGFGGANAHVILESYESRKAPLRLPSKGTLLPVLLSARNETSLREAARDLSAFLDAQPRESIYDIAYQSIFRREWHEYRAMAFGTSPESIVGALRDFADGLSDGLPVEWNRRLDPAQGPAFVFSGNGSTWMGMGKRLLEEVPVFRDAIREVDGYFRRYGGFSIEDELAGRNGEGRYELTEIGQPALFAYQVGVTRMLQSWGITPSVVTGHSVGEIAAAWASGALSLEAAVQVIYFRSHWQGTTKGCGQMTAVALGEGPAREQIEEAGLADTVTVACVNSSKGVTVSGLPESLSSLETALKGHGIRCKRLDLDYAFHGPAMEAIHDSVMRDLAGLPTSPGEVSFCSSVTGDVIDGRELGESYWWRNIRNPVLFEAAIKKIIEMGTTVFIEIGPHPILRGYVNDGIKDAGIEGRVIPTGSRGDDDPRRIWGGCCQALIAGAPVDWSTLFPWSGRFVQLPNYPWQRDYHWHKTTPDSYELLHRTKVHPVLGYRLRQHDLTWENQLDTTLNPSFADHVVGDATVFPGSGFADLALAAALAWHPGDFAEVEDLVISSPLPLGDTHSKIIRFRIDDADGSFTVKGREQVSPEPWVVHATGRIPAEPGDTLLRGKLPPFPMRAPDFNANRHRLLTRAVGLNYGSAYQAIDHGWVENTSILAVYGIPESIESELGTHHVHPALLDCAFQLIIHFLLESGSVHQDGVAFVPYRMGRVAYRFGKSRPHFALAEVLKRAPHSLMANFTIFDEDGVPVFAARDVHFRSIRLHKEAGDHLQFIDSRAIPMPQALAPPIADSISLEPFRAEVSELGLQAGKEAVRRYAEEIDPLLDSLCSCFTVEALEAMATNGSDLSAAVLQELRNHNPDIAPFLDYLLESAVSDKSIESVEGGWHIVSNRETGVSARNVWNILYTDYSDQFPVLHAVGRVGLHLKSVLEGRVTLSQVLPRGASLGALMERVPDPGLKLGIGKALEKLVAHALNNLPEGRRLGVLEISESAPPFAFHICESLDFSRGDYTFATPSPETFDELQPLEGRFPGTHVRRVEPGAGEAGLSPSSGGGTFQLAVVHCDFSSIENAGQALEFARAQLAPGGSILMLGYQPARWLDFAFGAQLSWWSRSAQGALVSRQLPPVYWQRQLERLGFPTVELLEMAPHSAAGPYFLLGRLEAAPALVPSSTSREPRCWLIVADPDDSSARFAELLAARIESRGDRAILTERWDVEDLSSRLIEARDIQGKLHGIVHLAGLNMLPTGAGPAECLAAQVKRCEVAANIHQACEATQIGTAVWLVTSGAATHLLPGRDRASRPTPTATIADAALWGFGTTLMNESPRCLTRLVDLEAPAFLDVAAEALERELEQPDAEQEVILTASGERFVLRLRQESRPDASAEVAEQGEPVPLRLGFQFPGQLRNLRWTPVSHARPEGNRIEVEVRATGLNFRDFMYTVGLLSDEAVMNGFAGPSLGLEFSGVVLEAGPDAGGFAPGDRIMGFGPACFSNRTVTDASSVVHMPAGLSFEAAATIPTAFFTAYYALRHLARLREGEKLLVHGATGGVGLAAIQLARLWGAEVYATAGAEEKWDVLRLLGVENIFHSRSLAFADEILAKTNGKGVDVVLNSLAGEAINRNLRVLKPFGRFLELGKRDFYENTKIGLRPFRNNISYFGIDADQLMSVYPDLTRQLFKELMALFLDGKLASLPYHVFEAGEIVEAFRFMQKARQIGKIVVTYERGIKPTPETGKIDRRGLELAADGSYLVTGGLSGFGLKAAEWLLSKGARNLILVSRSGPTSVEAMESIARMEQQAGVTVRAVSCDVCDKEAVSALLDEIRSSLPPLKGIIHAAAVFDDALIRNMSVEQIQRVLAPKVLGAHYLHEMTRNAPLDFFVLFSSATTLFGNPGQGNYVAANAWLEALARLRRAAGLPATCVRWGAIDDAGFLARNKEVKDALLNRMGGTAISSSVAFGILESLLLTNRSGLGVLELGWKSLGRFLPAVGAPKYKDILGQGGSAEKDESHSSEDFQRMLTELSDAELLKAITDALTHQLGEILRVQPEKIDVTRSMYDMGLDSLMGVELAASIETRFGIQLPVMTLNESQTVAKLSERITGLLRGGTGAADTDAGGEILAQVQQVITQHGVDAEPDLITDFAKDIQESCTLKRDGSRT